MAKKKKKNKKIDEDIKQSQQYQDDLRRSRLVLDLQKSGIWDQMHGTMPPEGRDLEPTEENWENLRKDIERIKKLSQDVSKYINQKN